MEHVDLSKMSLKQLAARAADLKERHFTRADSATAQEYYRVRIEQTERRVGALLVDGASINRVTKAERELAFQKAQHSFWSSQTVSEAVAA